jgi:hypothetical protein
MPDDRMEELLKGYRLPDVAPALDRRILGAGEAVIARARALTVLAGVGHELSNALGFGYVSYVIDLITTTDAEYHVDVI